MSTRNNIKMQSINFCYMSFMLQTVNQKTISMNGTYIKDLFIDEIGTIYAVMQDGKVILAIEIAPNHSTNDIQQWIDKNPSLHERVLMLMKKQ